MVCTVAEAKGTQPLKRPLLAAQIGPETGAKRKNSEEMNFDFFESYSENKVEDETDHIRPARGNRHCTYDEPHRLLLTVHLLLYVD